MLLSQGKVLQKWPLVTMFAIPIFPQRHYLLAFSLAQSIRGLHKSHCQSVFWCGVYARRGRRLISVWLICLLECMRGNALGFNSKPKRVSSWVSANVFWVSIKSVLHDWSRTIASHQEYATLNAAMTMCQWLGESSTIEKLKRQSMAWEEVNK